MTVELTEWAASSHLGAWVARLDDNGWPVVHDLVTDETAELVDLSGEPRSLL